MLENTKLRSELIPRERVATINGFRMHGCRHVRRREANKELRRRGCERRDTVHRQGTAVNIHNNFLIIKVIRF